MTPSELISEAGVVKLHRAGRSINAIADVCGLDEAWVATVVQKADLEEAARAADKRARAAVRSEVMAARLNASLTVALSIPPAKPTKHFGRGHPDLDVAETFIPEPEERWTGFRPSERAAIEDYLRRKRERDLAQFAREAFTGWCTWMA